MSTKIAQKLPQNDLKWLKQSHNANTTHDYIQAYLLIGLNTFGIYGCNTINK